MKRGSKCIGRTINLSNPETCIRPKRIQKLVEAEAMQPCPSGGTSSYWTPRPVTIRICTWKDMRRTCPPKSSVAAGLVYWTNAEGLWGSSADVEDLYYRLTATIAAAFSDDYDGDQIELPRVGEFKYRVIRTYNRAVFTVMNCIVETAVKLREQFRRILYPRENEQQLPAASSELDEDRSTAET